MKWKYIWRNCLLLKWLFKQFICGIESKAKVVDLLIILKTDWWISANSIVGNQTVCCLSGFSKQCICGKLFDSKVVFVIKSYYCDYMWCKCLLLMWFLHTFLCSKLFVAKVVYKQWHNGISPIFGRLLIALLCTLLLYGHFASLCYWYNN